MVKFISKSSYQLFITFTNTSLPLPHYCLPTRYTLMISDHLIIIQIILFIIRIFLWLHINSDKLDAIERDNLCIYMSFLTVESHYWSDYKPTTWLLYVYLKKNILIKDSVQTFWIHFQVRYLLIIHQKSNKIVITPKMLSIYHTSTPTMISFIWLLLLFYFITFKIRHNLI